MAVRIPERDNKPVNLPYDDIVRAIGGGGRAVARSVARALSAYFDHGRQAPRNVKPAAYMVRVGSEDWLVGAAELDRFLQTHQSEGLPPLIVPLDAPRPTGEDPSPPMSSNPSPDVGVGGGSQPGEDGSSNPSP